MTATAVGAAQPARRILASPYARRLARERGIALADLSGSGPRGRIVAADLAGAIPAPAMVNVAPAPSVPAMPAPQLPVAITGTVPLAPLDVLIAQVAAAAGRPVLRADALLRATALAVRSAGLGSESGDATIGIEPGTAIVRAAQVLALPVGEVGRLRASGGTDDATGGLLSLRISPASAFAPTLMPLRDGFALRLVLTPAVGPTSAGVLLCFDAARVSDEQALRLLEALADLLNCPLALFV